MKRRYFVLVSVVLVAVVLGGCRGVVGLFHKEVTDVPAPLSVHPTTSVPPGDVPMAYQYFAMPLSGSEEAVQLADSWVPDGV